MPKLRDSSKVTSKKATPYARKPTPAPRPSAEPSASEAEVMSLEALTENYIGHRDEVMQILFNLTKALKDEREFRQGLLKRLDALENKQAVQDKTQKEQAEKIVEHDRTLDEVDQNISDITCRWEEDLESMEAHSEEQINEKFGQFVTRLDHVESGLQEMRRAQNAIAADPVSVPNSPQNPSEFEGWGVFESWDSNATVIPDDEIEVLPTPTPIGNPGKAGQNSAGYVPGFIRNLQKKIRSQTQASEQHTKKDLQKRSASNGGASQEL